MAKQSRIPQVAFAAMRVALEAGRPVLVQSPRKGYVPSLSCGTCRTPARCRACNGPLGIPPGEGDKPGVVACRWCGRPETAFRCASCGSNRLRAVVFGSGRTAEELGRAFPGVKVISSGGSKIVDRVDDEAAIVVATPGAEPLGSYGAAILLDPWALLSRPDLRASEDTLAKWFEAASLVVPANQGGTVVVTAEVGLRVTQTLIRWDPVWAARMELYQRKEVELPPTVHMAVIDGPVRGVESFLRLVDLPQAAQVLGPVDLPLGVTLPGEYDESALGPAQRFLIRTPLGPRAELGKALRRALVARAALKEAAPLRVQVDPINIG